MSLVIIYKEKVVPALRQQFGYRNVLAVPKITKVTINAGVGRMTKDKQYIDDVVKGVTRLAGQKAVITRARKSISAFKVKAGDPVGVMVTLRGARMWDFLDKLVNVTLPRVRDFRGLNQTAVDQRGNLTLGFKEQTAWPEIKLDQVENTYGLELSVATTADNQAAGLALFRALGFPFKTAKDNK